MCSISNRLKAAHKSRILLSMALFDVENSILIIKEKQKTATISKLSDFV
jgi:hypothetical protein